MKNLLRIFKKIQVIFIKNNCKKYLRNKLIYFKQATVFQTHLLVSGDIILNNMELGLSCTDPP
jgi:hypothetical protein